MLRHIREFNDLMSWMDTEFWEQCDEIYQEKLQSLQEEVIAIQQGTHSAFKEIMADIEIRREQTIQNAEYFRNYELTLTKKQFEQDLALLDKEYESEKHNLHDMVLQSIEDKRKQIKEDKDDTPFQIEDLFRDAYSRISSRRNLRKRNGMDRNSSSSPSRQERRRYNRPTIPHNIHAQPTSTEEDELESEFLTMKGGVSTRRQATLNQSKR
ncbi:Sds3-like protein [Pilobolus umbonatus]|nr:Sds3-like protein [Pilobolus umbonatus]